MMKVDKEIKSVLTFEVSSLSHVIKGGGLESTEHLKVTSCFNSADSELGSASNLGASRI